MKAIVRASELYDADRRVTDPAIAHLARVVTIPHPLVGVDYADGLCGPHLTPVCARRSAR